MIRDIEKYGSIILSTPSTNVDYTDGVETIIEDLIDTLKTTTGIGLAAPQIGINKRVFIVDYKDLKKVFINPIIIDRSTETILGSEGCLSIPKLSGNVERNKTITISYQDESFTNYTDTYTGDDAILIQHEYDHLDGIMWIDRLSKLHKAELFIHLQLIKAGKI